MATLESLPDELLLLMFDFLDDARLFRAFSGLNLRLSMLLFSSARAHRLDLQSMSRYDFHRTFEQYIPVVADRILSIRLSNDDETPGLIEDFLRRHMPLRIFSHLRSLTLSHVSSCSLVKKIINECRTVPHLTHLRFEKCLVDLYSSKYQMHLNDVCALPRLLHYHLDVISIERAAPWRPTIACAFLRQLVIDSVTIHVDTLHKIAVHLPHLQHLAVRIDANQRNYVLSCHFESLISFKVYVDKALPIMNKLLERMPNLRRLAIKSYNRYLGDLTRCVSTRLNDACVWTTTYYPDNTTRYRDGSDWEYIVVNHLPKLHTFHLQMRFEHSMPWTKEEQVDILLRSYSTHFWTHEHRWFVRYEWNVDPTSPYLCLYTLPCTFDRYSTQHPALMSKSTSPTEADYWPADRKHKLLPVVAMLNVPYLEISIPVLVVGERPFSILHRLRSLSVFLYSDSPQACQQLQSFIDRAPHLYALKISCGKLTSTNMGVLQLHSHSVRRLDLQNYTEHEGCRWFNREQCKALSESPLGAPCEMLRINVADPTNVVELAYAMPKLRALSVQIENDSGWSREDETMDFLRGFLFESGCTISRDERNRSVIRLWIR